MDGWIKLYRILKNKPIWKNSTPEQKTVLITLLLMANHEEKEWEWMSEKFKIAPGQCVTSLESIRQECGKGISIQNVRSALLRFKNLQFLTYQSTKIGRLITICNWEDYQQPEDSTQQRTQQTGNKEVTTNKNDKNDKNNINIEERKKNFANSLNPYLEKYGREMLNDFFLYWTEHGERDRKMRFEKEKTFGIGRRLSIWKRNEEKYEKNKGNIRRFNSDTTKETIETIQREIEQYG